MPSRLHHVVCPSADPEALVGYLTEVVGLEVTIHTTSDGRAVGALLGWPDVDEVETWMLGSGSSGLVEVVRIPDALAGDVASGVALLAFATPDVGRYIGERAPADVRGPVTFSVGDTEAEAAVVDVGGVALEFIRF